MLTVTDSRTTPLSNAAVRLAEQSGMTLQHLISQDQEGSTDAVVRLSVEQPDGSRADLALPPATLSLLASVLRELGHGKQVAVLSTDTELTTQQAANILNVSRPYLVKLLEEQQIPYRSVGPRRRLLLEDLLRYQARDAAKRNQGLAELVAESQKLGLY